VILIGYKGQTNVSNFTILLQCFIRADTKLYNRVFKVNKNSQVGFFQAGIDVADLYSERAIKEIGRSV
jgi:hypothetical protein